MVPRQSNFAKNPQMPRLDGFLRRPYTRANVRMGSDPRTSTGNMKSEHRHELQTNDLGKLAVKLTAFFQKYGNQILMGLCGAMLVAAVVIYLVRSSTADKQAGWTRYAACQSAEDFANVADDYEGATVGAWARLNEAEMHLQTGIQQTFTDRAAAISDLNKAKESFDKLLAEKSIPAAVRERGLLGLARFLETTADAQTEPAIEAYSKFVNDFPNSINKEFAEQRIDALKTGGSKEFYAWFKKQNPKPEDRATPQDGFPSDPHGSREITLPEIPDMLRPTVSTDVTAPIPPAPEQTGPPAPSLPENVSPDDATPPDSAKPVAPRPAAPKPDSAKPDTKKPSTPKPENGANSTDGSAKPK